MYIIHIYIYVSMYILYIAPTKKKGCPFCTRQQAFFLSKRCQFWVCMSKWVSLHSSYWIPLYVPPYFLASQKPKHPHLPTSPNSSAPPPGIFGFLLFRTPGTQVISNSQGRGLRGRCWGGCRELYLDVPGRSGWINGEDQGVISPIYT